MQRKMIRTGKTTCNIGFINTLVLKYLKAI